MLDDLTEETISALEKIQGIANLLTYHPDQEYAVIGVLLNDIAHPIIMKIREKEKTIS